MIARQAALLAAFAALVGCGKAQNPAPSAPEVMVAQVLHQKIIDWDEYTGRFQAIDTVEVRPRVSGYIDRVLFREGQPVKKGDTLIVIDPRPYQADFDRAKAGLALAKAQRELATLEADRVHKLKDSGAVSQEELDERVSALHQQEASVAAAQAEFDSAALNLSFTNVTAPIDGQASRAEVTRGNLVTGGNNGGTLLTTIVSTDPMYVYFEGDEHAYLRYNELARAGERQSSRNFANPVRVGLANEDGFPHEGRMDFVDNQLNVRTGTIRARAILDNKDGLFTPGLFARVQLLGAAERDAVLIEERAIGTDQTQNFVLVLAPENKLEYRPVQLGRGVRGLRIVSKGLKPGETIVVNGLQRVRPGMQVTPKQTTMGLPQAASGAGG
ncbi:MAG TPA: efflux RND transporter periplasmic adaptor subunit [Steroidobacteraceae bacterium]|nr:efflux RND transporter periplasmic adaptor subunit [Steroidobacteraceae bacterium]